MTLKQAFTIWANIQKNIAIAAKGRQAVQAVLMKKYNDMHLEVFSESLCRQIFEKSTAPDEWKVAAASILVYVLQWGAEHEYCLPPTFDYTIASIKDKPEDPEPSLHIEEKKENDDEPEPAPIQEEKKQNPLTLTSDNSMKSTTEKKPKGRMPKPVAQLNPDTLEVVRIWPSRSEAEREMDAYNLDRAMASRRMAAGYYWCSPDLVKLFQPNPRSRHALSNKVQPKPESTPEETPAPTPATVKTSDITALSNDELVAEMRRRGWKGDITITLNVKL